MNIDIYSNYVFPLILASPITGQSPWRYRQKQCRSPVTPPPPATAPINGIQRVKQTSVIVRFDRREENIHDRNIRNGARAPVFALAPINVSFFLFFSLLSSHVSLTLPLSVLFFYYYDIVSIQGGKEKKKNNRHSDLDS